tara:strand:+ start:1633 stop:1977 length:345 start_codon:yes stop_codon:yes gene_type:complete
LRPISDGFLLGARDGDTDDDYLIGVSDSGTELFRHLLPEDAGFPLDTAELADGRLVALSKDAIHTVNRTTGDTTPLAISTDCPRLAFAKILPIEGGDYLVSGQEPAGFLDFQPC